MKRTARCLCDGEDVYEDGEHIYEGSVGEDGEDGILLNSVHIYNCGHMVGRAH